MKVVKFNRPHLMYQRGETAGFPEDHANKLIAAGIARDPNAPAPHALPDVALPGEDDGLGAPAGVEGEEGGEPGTSEDGSDASDPGAPPAQGKGRK